MDVGGDLTTGRDVQQVHPAVLIFVQDVHVPKVVVLDAVLHLFRVPQHRYNGHGLAAEGLGLLDAHLHSVRANARAVRWRCHEQGGTDGFHRRFQQLKLRRFQQKRHVPAHKTVVQTLRQRPPKMSGLALEVELQLDHQGLRRDALVGVDAHQAGHPQVLQCDDVVRRCVHDCAVTNKSNKFTFSRSLASNPRRCS